MMAASVQMCVCNVLPSKGDAAVTIVKQLLADTWFIFERTVESQNPSSEKHDITEHLFFGLMYFYVNQFVIGEILDALYGLPEPVRKAHDPYPNDRAWSNEHRGAAAVVISTLAWRNYSITGAFDCPITDDDINMLVRALRIAESAPIKLRHRHLLMSPAGEFYKVLRGSAVWPLVVPSRFRSG
jgi:hypothetical protein